MRVGRNAVLHRFHRIHDRVVDVEDIQEVARHRFRRSFDAPPVFGDRVRFHHAVGIVKIGVPGAVIPAQVAAAPGLVKVLSHLFVDGHGMQVCINDHSWLGHRLFTSIGI